MKRLQIMLEDDAYEALGIEATRVHASKAALVRRYVRVGLRPLPALADDPLSALSASADFEPTDADETVYGH
jgi:hypothetical protein